MKRRTTWIAIAAGSALTLGAVAWSVGPEPSAAAPTATTKQPAGPTRPADETITRDGLTPAVSPVPDDDRAGNNTRRVIGWDQARQRLGGAMPTGRGIPVGQVEAGEAYAPNARDRRLRGISFMLQSGDTGNSDHASGVARYAFGQDGPSPGVARVHCYSVSNWLGEGYLRTGSDQPPDDWNEARVFNHSWVAQNAGYAPQVLRRIDWLADERDILCVVGLNNGQGAVPDLLASGYNLLSVGTVAGNHSGGVTTTEGEGRCKPELVAPGSLTSWSTPVVTGCVAVLLQEADALAERDPDSPDALAVRSEVVKALLLGGAHKPAGWSPSDGEPLDRRWGAGIVDIDRALLMLAGGNTPPGPTIQRYGWATHALPAEADHGYTFTTTADQGEACFTLVWHRKVAGGTAEVRNNQTGETRTVWNNSAALAQYDLELVRTDDAGNEEVVATSASAIDNVEVIYLREMPAGTWTLRVKRGADGYGIPWDYALAWRIEAE